MKTIPALPEGEAARIFVEGSDSPFAAIDANLAAWLPGRYEASEPISFDSFTLSEHKNNQELIESLGGEETVRRSRTFTPQQIRHLAERSVAEEVLRKDGFSNLFFVLAPSDNELYVVGVVWDGNRARFVPYIYRPRNLYRSWSKRNQVFVRGPIDV